MMIYLSQVLVAVGETEADKVGLVIFHAGPEGLAHRGLSAKAGINDEFSRLEPVWVGIESTSSSRPLKNTSKCLKP